MKEKNILYNIKELDEILCKNNCLIYGGGNVAKTIIEYASGKQYIIDKIVVSEACGNPHEILGIQVCAIKKYQGNVNEKTVVVSVEEKTHDEIENGIDGYNFKGIYFVSNELYRKVRYNIGDYQIECLNQIEKLEEKMLLQEKKLLRFIPRPCLEYMVLNIVDHCNLRCKGCDHFACVADPYFVAYETIHQDLKRMAEIFQGDYITKIAVMGGEPLLHPDLLKILKDVRKYFPYTTIRLTTNGLLLLKQEDEFWRVCKEQKVTIVNTKYPLNLDFNAIKDKAEREEVKFRFFEGTGGAYIKKSFKKVVNLKGDSNPVESFANCHISNYGNFLMEGKFYGCPFSCQSYRIFNKKFNQNLRMTEQDFLDIYEVRDMREILEFAARPKYYCRYCSGLSPLSDWSRSKGKISEWVNEEE